MRKIFVIVLFCVLICSCFSVLQTAKAEENSGTEWSKTFGGNDSEEGYCVQQTDDGGYIIVGETFSNGENVDVMLVKTNSQGDEEWNKTYGGEYSDVGMFVEQTSDGGYIITGHRTVYNIVENQYDMGLWLIKTDKNGTEEWNTSFGENGLDDGETVRQTPDGGYIIAGNKYISLTSDSDIMLIKTDKNGSEVWNRTYGGIEDDYACFLIQNNNGYLILGYTKSFGIGETNCWLIKTDNNGNQQWNKTYGGLYNIGESICQTNDDGYIIVGWSIPFNYSPSDLWLIKIDSNCNQQWNKTYGGGDMDCGNDIKQTSDGGYIIAGETESFDANSKDLWLIKTDSHGNKEWDNIFGGPNYDAGYSVLQIQDGSYIIAGFTDTTEKDYDIWLVKTFGDKDISHEEISPREKTPGFELILVICAIALVLFWQRRRI